MRRGVQCWQRSRSNHHPSGTAAAAVLLRCCTVLFWVRNRLMNTCAALLHPKRACPACPPLVQCSCRLAAVSALSSYFSAPCVFVAGLRGHWGALWRSTAHAGGNRWVKVCGSWVLLEGPSMLHHQLCAYCPGLKSALTALAVRENVTILAGPLVGPPNLQ